MYLPLSTYYMYTYVLGSKNTLHITGTVCVRKNYCTTLLFLLPDRFRDYALTDSVQKFVTLK